ncbi:interleukin-10 receptor subunit beta [Lampris incognitus]|uniref:interleukin-10 receptor subunit beta n=1 Tax=Lampris incognitus TaxID=2546036 RepID=UPI0024B55E90|nr:interleukin-10 receptor subunit beta [Lampris incognitus]
MLDKRSFGRRHSSTMSSAAIYVFLLIWCLPARAVLVLADLAKPQNVTMITLNTQYIISWDWDQHSAENHTVTFTAQYMAKYRWERNLIDWITVCERTRHTECDLTALDLHYFAIYVLRVQANTDKQDSDWVLKDFCPDKEAALGPPSKVDLSLAGSLLDVSISDALTSTNGSMKELQPMMYYRIIYWEHSADKKALRTKMVDSSANLVTLPDLKAWTWYCVSVQSVCDYYNKSSNYTAPLCLQTEGATPWWQILLYFAASLLLCFLGGLLPFYVFFQCYRILKRTMYPSIQLPVHILEYLHDFSPGSDVPRLLTPDSEPELICDRVSICPEAGLLEIHIPPHFEALTESSSGMEPDSSGRHSRQNSGDSKDSGMYSTEGGSALRQQPGSKDSSMGIEVSWQDPSLEQVKMQDMGPESRAEAVIPDEGVIDMCF